MTAPLRKTCHRFNDPGHAHFLTFSCFHRQPFLTGDRARGWLADAVRAALNTHRLHLWAYVVMPEHVHLLVWPARQPYSISGVLKSMKQPVGHRAVAYVRRHAPEFLPRMLENRADGREHARFWQPGGGYDRNLWSPAAIWDKIDYVHNNPVKRRLCERPEDWFWSSAATFAGGPAGPLPLDLSALPADPRPARG